MSDKDLDEAPQEPTELTDTEIEDATGGAVAKPGTIYEARPSVKLD